MSKRGKFAVVIIFCILLGDAAPAFIQYGPNPRELFYTIVFMTLPYTGALVLVFLVLAKDNEHPYAQFMVSGIILLLCFALGAYLHLGISEVDVDQVLREMELANQVPYGAPQKPPHHVMANDVFILFKFYFNKYGPALFIAATLASIVITWDILKWWDGRQR